MLTYLDELKQQMAKLKYHYDEAKQRLDKSSNNEWA